MDNDDYIGLSQVVVKAAPLQEKTITPSTTQQVVVPDSGQYGLSKVTVNAANITGRIVKQLVGTLKGELHVTSGTINVSTILNNYRKLTTNDFIMELKEVGGFGERSENANTNSSLSYDSSTGIITCNGIGCCTSGSWNGGWARVNVYYLYISND